MPPTASTTSAPSPPCSGCSSLLLVSWLIWALLAVALAVGELLTPGLFFLGPVALAATAAGVAAALGAGAAVALLIFIGGSLASLGILRPIARRHVRLPALS